MVKSVSAGKLIQDPPVGSTIADGIALKKPSKMMFENFISKLVDDVMTVSDDELARTIVFLMERGKTLVEGAGAAGLAALFSGRFGRKPKKAIATLSGGNIDLNTVGRVIDRGFQVVGRLVKIAVTVPDVPGSVNKLTKLIADKRANVLEIYHDRVSDRIGLRETMIEFTLETTGPDQVEEIREGFKKLGAKLLN
jgi:threonine dehydratase